MDVISLIVIAILALMVIVNLGKILTGVIKLVVRLVLALGALYLGYLIYIGQFQLHF